MRCTSRAIVGADNLNVRRFVKIAIIIIALGLVVFALILWGKHRSVVAGTKVTNTDTFGPCHRAHSETIYMA